ncbi:hypothetical protein Gorai_007372 [Gossypium raimondii]|uniref:Programmed cell death protein 4 n=2 Tax=Gossypium raimondii TaxID=29730 RepID=A0A7J8Q7N3_GOSRA|nr:hypothetical protein [Gossypium raimondii]
MTQLATQGHRLSSRTPRELVKGVACSAGHLDTCPAGMEPAQNASPINRKDRVLSKQMPNKLELSSAEKMKHSGKNSKGNGKQSDVRKDRKSGTGMNGSPKKGGHGGKFTWVGDGLSPAEIGVETELVDVTDPNFEDPYEILAD